MTCLCLMLHARRNRQGRVRFNTRRQKCSLVPVLLSPACSRFVCVSVISKRCSFLVSLKGGYVIAAAWPSPPILLRACWPRRESTGISPAVRHEAAQRRSCKYTAATASCVLLLPLPKRQGKNRISYLQQRSSGDLHPSGRCKIGGSPVSRFFKKIK